MSNDKQLLEDSKEGYLWKHTLKYVEKAWLTF